jgi:hypothetical protein
VDAPNALVNMSGGADFWGSIIASTITNSGGTAIHYDSSLPDIRGGNYIWFNAVVNNVNGLPSSGQVKLYLTNSMISFTANGTSYNVSVPNAVVTFNSMTGLGTTFSTTSNRWSTSVPKSSLTGNTFVTGVAFPVPSDFPTGIQNVAWSASYSTDTPGITLQWQWGAAVYTSFNTCYAYQSSNSSNACFNSTSNTNVLGVNAEDGTADAHGSDPAGTPETYKASVIFGVTGGGGTNYTGYFSPGAGVVPTVAPMSVSPSSLDFSVGNTVNQDVGSTSGAMTAILTNNDSVSYTVSSITKTGTNATDFTETDNCVASSPLMPGSSCTISVTFTPGDIGTRTAKISINDGASNSPQTLYLSGTGGMAAVSASPNPLSFGIVTQGTPSTMSVTLSNTANAALNVPANGITFTGANASDFTQTNNCGSTLAAGSNCTISVTFTPSTRSNESATLSISGGAGSPPAVTLTGSGQ